MKIISAKFLTSSEFSSQAPRMQGAQVAMLGRSNVGKSSLINALCNHKGLAKSSSTPGKTRLINMFEATFEDKSKLIIIDLPGFGYARVSKAERAKWDKTLNRYLLDNPQISAYLHLLDSRHEGLAIDEASREYLQGVSPNTAYVNVFTKTDKLNQSERNRLKAKNPGAFMISSAKKTGLEPLLKYLHELAVAGAGGESAGESSGGGVAGAEDAGDQSGGGSVRAGSGGFTKNSTAVQNRNNETASQNRHSAKSPQNLETDLKNRSAKSPENLETDLKNRSAKSPESFAALKPRGSSPNFSHEKLKNRSAKSPECAGSELGESLSGESAGGISGGAESLGGGSVNPGSGGFTKNSSETASQNRRIAKSPENLETDLKNRSAKSPDSVSRFCDGNDRSAKSPECADGECGESLGGGATGFRGLQENRSAKSPESFAALKPRGSSPNFSHEKLKNRSPKRGAKKKENK